MLQPAPGTLIGTTNGTVFQLTAPADGGAWTEAILHSFGCCGPDGSDPAYASVAAGPNGVLYGTTAYGGTAGAGGGEIYGGLSRGPNGEIFGTTQMGGVRNSTCPDGTCGTIFRVTP